MLRNSFWLANAVKWNFGRGGFCHWGQKSWHRQGLLSLGAKVMALAGRGLLSLGAKIMAPAREEASVVGGKSRGTSKISSLLEFRVSFLGRQSSLHMKIGQVFSPSDIFKCMTGQVSEFEASKSFLRIKNIRQKVHFTQLFNVFWKTAIGQYVWETWKTFKRTLLTTKY